MSGPPRTHRCLGQEAQGGCSLIIGPYTPPTSGHSCRHPRAFAPWLSTHPRVPPRASLSLPLQAALSKLNWVIIEHPKRRQKTGHRKAL